MDKWIRKLNSNPEATPDYIYKLCYNGVQSQSQLTMILACGMYCGYVEGIKVSDLQIFITWGGGLTAQILVGFIY